MPAAALARTDCTLWSFVSTLFATLSSFPACLLYKLIIQMGAMMALPFSGILNYPSFSPIFYIFLSGIGTVNLFTAIFASLFSTRGPVVLSTFISASDAIVSSTSTGAPGLFCGIATIISLAESVSQSLGLADLPPNCTLPGKGSQFCAD